MFVTKLFAAAMTLVLSISAAILPVYASPDVNIDYAGEIDPYSGEPVSSEAAQNQQIVSIMTGVSYDRKTHMFNYSVAGSTETVSCSVAGGMVTTDTVSLSVPSDIIVNLYKNGEETEDTDYSKIKDEGSYSLVVSSGELKSQLLTFTIVPKKTGALTVFQVPSGFSLVNVMLNDEKQQYSLSANAVDMKKDGEYVINYRCEAIGVNYSLEVTVDHTPPEVTFEGVKNGTAKNPVTVSGVEKNDTIKVIRDDQEMNISKDHILRSPGKYVVTVTDDAGNFVTEKFEIKFYLNEQGWVFGLIIVAIIVSAVVYMIMSKKRLRVR